jgi:hypothetical protein
MRGYLGALAVLGLSLLSCASAIERPDGARDAISIKEIRENCSRFIDSEVVLRAKYMGWRCPKECGAPPLTRSDTCLVDESGCIYAYGLMGLDPINDVGKEVEVKAKVLTFGGKCYLKVISRDVK